jgi:hypothetical protein
MKRLLLIVSLFTLMSVGCEDKQQVDYVNCSWLRIENGKTDYFYQVGNNGNPLKLLYINNLMIGDWVYKSNWIHLYKDDSEVEIENENGSTRTINLSNKDYTYGKF